MLVSFLLLGQNNQHPQVHKGFILAHSLQRFPFIASWLQSRVRRKVSWQKRNSPWHVKWEAVKQWAFLSIVILIYTTNLLVSYHPYARWSFPLSVPGTTLNLSVNWSSYHPHNLVWNSKCPSINTGGFGGTSRSKLQ